MRRSQLLAAIKSAAASLSSKASPWQIKAQDSLDDIGVPAARYRALADVLSRQLQNQESSLPPQQIHFGLSLTADITVAGIADQIEALSSVLEPADGCPAVDLPERPDHDACILFRDGGFRCRILQATKNWCGKSMVLFTDTLGDLSPNPFNAGERAILVQKTRESAVFQPRTYAVTDPGVSITGASTVEDYASAIWQQQPAELASCHFLGWSDG